MCQPYHLLANLSGREIPSDIPIPHYPVNPISASLRLAREKTMRAAATWLKQESPIATRDCGTSELAGRNLLPI
jgi:hypothetical protein